jgi:drug/metabolite transporter (DMT)-like permease
MAERTDAEDEHDGTSRRQSRSFACLVVLLAVGMLTAGTVQTVSLKFQDRTIVDQETRAHFSHPAVQSLEMFIGEFLCLIPHLAVWLCTRSTQAALARQAGTSLDSIDPEAALELYFKQRSLRAKVCGVISFAIPAACDAFATTLLNVGLLLTFASVYQMLRGSLVLFTGLLAATVLRKKLHTHHWIGMMLILIGALIIGLVSVIQEGSSRSPPSPSPPSSPNQDSVDLSRSSGTFVGQVVGSTTSLLSSESAQRLIGDTLIVIAQLLMATQFVVEEKLMNRFKTPPLLAVGLEGFWGICMCGVALPLMSLFKQASGKPLESLPVAVEEISHNLSLLLSTITSIVAIAFFNGLGLFITRYLAAGTRATIDALRTISVYLVGLSLDWEDFHWLEVRCTILALGHELDSS